ncbi:hypothetical protein QJS66_09755 [Kocuria rhizophila]|nr:hypothetical protein QJS66_09755 [Kocuria rhizophila]
MVPGRQLQQARLAMPFEDVSFASHDEYAAAVVHYLDRDVHGSLRGEDGPREDGDRVPRRRPHGARVRTSRRWGSRTPRGSAAAPTDPSWKASPRARPCCQISSSRRSPRAGVVRFLGPEPRFRGGPARRVLRGGLSVGRGVAPVRSRWLIEAMPPTKRRPPRFRRCSPACASGLVRARLMETQTARAPSPARVWT